MGYYLRRMEIKSTERDVAIIDLTGAEQGGMSLHPVSSNGQPPAVRMTMDQLRHNYATIVKSKAIYYPVAYQFLYQLGRGRQGQVFLALRQGARGCITEHAIKVFDPDLYRSPEEYWTDMGRIASQVSKLERVHCPNLVWSYSYEETYGIGYVQMEAINGIDLGRLLRKDHLEIVRRKCGAREWNKLIRPLFRLDGDRMCFQPGFVVFIMREALQGLERLHEMNFLHSDMKPGNIMLDRLGTVRLVDFGRAVMIGEHQSFLLGSPLYMSPEGHRRQPPDMRSDLYSLGLVALELLRGEPLTSDDGIAEADLLDLKLHLQERLPDMLPAYVLANRKLVGIISRFLDPDPAKRYATAREAEVGDDGWLVIDKQLVHANLDTEYERDLADYLAKLLDERTQRVDVSLLQTS
jgi:serine/threonine-protein kinase